MFWTTAVLADEGVEIFFAIIIEKLFAGFNSTRCPKPNSLRVLNRLTVSFDTGMVYVASKIGMLAAIDGQCLTDSK